MGRLDLEQQHKRHCPECGYDLRGQTHNRCPECGNEFDPDDPGTFAASPPPRMRLRSILSPLCNRYVYTGVILSIATAVYLVARDHTLSQTLPLPLKAPLSRLDAERLLPYVLVEAKRFDPPLYVLDQPPLDDCVCWLMQDEQARRVSLFVTYSSASLENPMHIAHGSRAGGTRWVGRTEECMTIASRGTTMSVPLCADEFEKHAKEVLKRWITVRTCYANGEFCRDVWGAGQAIRKSHERHVYFSGVDVSIEFDSQTTLEEATESAKRFLQVVIPVLLEDHWPDWENRPISPPSWFPWLPVKSKPLPATQPSSEER